MKNVSVFVDKILTGNKAAGFDYSSGTIFIKKKPGLIDLYHEGYHAEQYLKIGKESYIGLGSLASGNHVLNRIMGKGSPIFLIITQQIPNRNIRRKK